MNNGTGARVLKQEGDRKEGRRRRASWVQDRTHSEQYFS